MKRIAFFIIALAISLIINAQDYQSLWKEFDYNIENLLPESAEKVLDKIEKQAVQDKNDVQLLKITVKKCEILGMTAEDSQDTIIGLCKTYLPKLSKASQVILNVEIAKYDDNFDEILSYQDDDFIKTVSMEQYADLFRTEDEKTVYDIKIEPTLYDYVMHCIIKRYKYLQEEESLYSKLLDFDWQSNYIKAYYNNKIEQLGYINNQEDFEKYSQLAAECIDNEYVAKIKIKQVEYLTYENSYVKAKELCDEAMAILDKNHPLYKQCVEYLNSLTQKTVAVQMNKVYVEGTTIPVGLTYRNTTAAKYKLYKVSANEFTRMLRLDNEDLLATLTGKQLVIENTVKLTDETDYDEHSSLIALTALQNGQYFLVFSNSAIFDDVKNLIFMPFQVSNLSYFSLKNDNHVNIYVVNRETGAAVSNVKAQFVKREYKYKENTFNYKVLGEAVSDRNGVLVTPFEDNYGYFMVNLYSKNDTLVAHSNELFTSGTTKDKLVIKTNLYTDRAIYRPGQTVHYKGVIIRRDNKHSEILPDYEELLYFRDPNYQIIDTVKVKSDDFGAFSGSLVIPTDRMRGVYTITTDNHDGMSFNVEDYKRPTFEVTFETPEQDFKVGDTVTVTGKVAALSGFGLDNVRYRYTVTRKTKFPYRFWDWPPHYVADEMIASDESITSADGSFSFDFQLLPSSYVDIHQIPRYTFEVKVEATNKQGETQTETYEIAVTYNKYAIAIESNDSPSPEASSIELNNFKDLQVSVSNIAGKPVSTKIECKIFKINNIDRYYKDLGDFDRQLLSDQLLKAYFPKFDYYSKEKDHKELVHQQVINVNGKSPLFSGNEKLRSGKYIIELKSVDDSLSVFVNKYVVFEAKSKKMPYKAMCWADIDKTTALPGEMINFYVGSSESNVSALVIVKRGTTIIKSERISLNNNVYRLSYKVREEDRGQLDFQVAMVKYNTENHLVHYVNVPFNNMDLDITLNTKRNMMLPGETGTWSVTVKDYKDKPAVTSLMAVMYDAALDNFAKNRWDLHTKPMVHASSLIMSDKSFSPQTKYQPFNIARFYYDNSLQLSSMSLIPSNHYGRRTLSDNIYYCVEEKAVVADYKVPTNVAKIRKDFNETAFFFPDLRTDENGDATFTFIMPDALTRWHFKILAYNKNLSVGQFEKSIVTQQPLMIMADMPRFVYDEDTLWIAANVINLSDEALSPYAKLEIFDENNNPIELILSNQNINISEIPARHSQSVRWKVAMRKDLGVLTFRFSAITEGFSDAEQHLLPVLSTEVFLTQTYSLMVNANTSKVFVYGTNNDNERNYDFKLDVKANPILYAVQSLPYIAEGDEKFVLTAFNRYFVNMMAQEIIKNNPNIKELLDENANDTLSELQKYEDVKAILLKETPWVFEAKSEAKQRANVAKLFDTEAINDNIASALSILEDKQTVNGGWPWMDGMPESEYITQYILSGLGRSGDNTEMTEKAFHFLENKVVTRYKKLDTQKKKDNAVCDFITMKDFFAMSYFSYTTGKDFNEAKDFYINKLYKDWRRFSVEEQAYIALILNRNGHSEVAKLVIKSLRERALKNELGMYWRYISVETEARILEAFNDIEPIADEIDNMRLWILTQKRTNMWENDRATVEAIFALMNRGTVWNENLVDASMTTDDDGTIHVYVHNNTNHVIWGGVFRQYFVPIDNVQKHNDAMKIKREIIMPENVKVGDKVTVEITFENSQDMEFVYLKDLRGACFEPTEQLSQYHWDNGLWYYQSTTDVSMEYFFEYLPKGKHTVSYDMYVTKDGSFSAGYSYIQCQYTPEFSAYSNGSRIAVK